MNSFCTICIVRKINATDSPQVESVALDVWRWCVTNSVDIVTEIEESTLVVAIGGDGTVINAALRAAEVGAMVLGFNLGKVGFLADFSSKKVIETLTAAWTNQLHSDVRTILLAKIGDDEHYALNDFVISCTLSDTTMHYDLMVNNRFAGTHSANGVIISSATGSTAYALSVGGAIIMPSLDVMQVVPIAAQTLTSRPLIVSGEGGVGIKYQILDDRPVTIRADGNPIKVSNESMRMFGYVTISKSEKTVKLLHHHSWNHFDILTQKLGWL